MTLFFNFLKNLPLNFVQNFRKCSFNPDNRKLLEKLALFQCLEESTYASKLLGGKKDFEECLVDFQNKVHGRDPNITATNKPENASNVYFTFVQVEKKP